MLYDFVDHGQVATKGVLCVNSIFIVSVIVGATAEVRSPLVGG